VFGIVFVQKSYNIKGIHGYVIWHGTNSIAMGKQRKGALSVGL